MSGTWPRITIPPPFGGASPGSGGHVADHNLTSSMLAELWNRDEELERYAEELEARIMTLDAAVVRLSYLVLILAVLAIVSVTGLVLIGAQSGFWA